MKEYRAGIYLRLSKQNSEDNNSIEIQREITTNYAIKNGYNVIKEYVDNGYSGILDSRPGLDKMLVDISRGLINMVIVKDISRLTRNKNKTGWYTEIFFPDNDVRFISVTEFIDSGERYKIDDTIMLRGIANQFYITDISKKIRANKMSMKKAGQFVENTAPYGYKKAENDKHKVVVDDEVKTIIKNIFNMYINGKTASQISKYLNDINVETPSSHLKMKNMAIKWNAEQINDILRNPFYIGNTILNKYETNYLTKRCMKNKKKDNLIIKENTHEPIIAKEIYNKVQEIKKNKRTEKVVKHKYLLRDLVYCGNCKRKIQYKVHKSSNKQRFLYGSASFNCNLLYKDKCDNDMHIKEKDLNEIVRIEIIKRLSIIETEEAIKKIVSHYEVNNTNMKKVKQYKNELEKLERKKIILYKKKCDNYMTVEEFKEKYEITKEKLEQYKNLIEQLNQEDTCNLDEEKIREIVQKFKSGNYMSNNFLKEIINRIEVYPENRIEIIFNL